MAADRRVGVGLGGDQRVANRYHKLVYGSNLGRMRRRWTTCGSAATSLDQPEQKMAGISYTAARTDWQFGIWATTWKTPAKEVRSMGSAQSARLPVVRVSGRAQAELRTGEALVFDWTSLAFCCAAAGEISLRPTSLLKAQRSPAYVPLRTGDGPSVFAHRRAYPMLVGRDIQVDCRCRLGIRSFSSSLPPQPRAAHVIRARDRRRPPGKLGFRC